MNNTIYVFQLIVLAEGYYWSYTAMTNSYAVKSLQFDEETNTTELSTHLFVI